MLLATYAIAQGTYQITRIEEPNLFGVTDQSFAEGPDGSIYFFHSSSDILYRYLDDSLSTIPCPSCSRLNDVAVNDEGQIYIADGREGVIQILPDGKDTLLVEGRMDVIAVGREGSIYAIEEAGISGAIFIYQDSFWSEYDDDNTALPSSTYFDLDVDTAGHLWIAARDGLVRWDGMSFTTYTDPDYSNTYYDVEVGPDNVIWVSPSNANIRSFDGTSWTSYEDLYPLFVRADAMVIGGDGTIWTAESFDPFKRFDGINPAEEIPQADFGIEEPTIIRAMYVDRQNRLWVSGDLNYVFYVEDMTVPTRDIRRSDLPLSIYPNPTTDLLQIKWPESERASEKTLQLYSSDGMQVLQKTGSLEQLFVAHLPSGIYTYILTGSDHFWTGQITKN